MEHASLIVLALLQLSVAEIPKAIPGWYAANLINDSNYSPKPITEIFSTENAFSSDKPLIILQSTQSPITQDIVGTSPTTWSTGTTNTQTQFPRIIGAQNDLQRLLQSDLSSTMPQTTFTTSQAPINNIQSIIANNRPDVASILGTLEQILQTNTQVPTVAVTSSTKQTWSPTQSTLPSSPYTEWSTYSTTPYPTLFNEKQTYSTLPPYIPTFAPKTRNNNANEQTTQNIRPCDLVKEKTKLTKTNSSSPTLLMPLPKPILTIRLKAPRGSITNLHINPSTTTTTKKPTTTRRRKSSKRRSDYESCLDSCKDKRDPICSSPAGITPIESNTLKGFPSLCHMACHNSFRKELTYEKVADGRCGRLRTRIRTVEKNKIKREDLKKAQYTLTNSEPETVVEISSLMR